MARKPRGAIRNEARPAGGRVTARHVTAHAGHRLSPAVVVVRRRFVHHRQRSVSASRPAPRSRLFSVTLRLRPASAPCCPSCLATLLTWAHAPLSLLLCWLWCVAVLSASLHVSGSLARSCCLSRCELCLTRCSPTHALLLAVAHISASYLASAKGSLTLCNKRPCSHGECCTR